MLRYEKGKGASPALFLALPVLCLIIGIVLVSLGIRNAVSDSTKGYEKTTGYLVDYTLYEAGGYDAARKTESADTYRLIYSYTVNGEAYTLSTDYGTSIVPSVGSETEILYNPENPGEAVVGGPNQSGNQLIFIGLFFALGSVPFFLPFLPNKKKEKKEEPAWEGKKHEFDWVAVGIGLFFVGVAYGALAMISSSYSLVGIARYFVNNFHFMLLVPVLMALGGVAMTCRGLFYGKLNPKSQEERPNRRK